jgi:hypothetical protein
MVGRPGPAQTIILLFLFLSNSFIIIEIVIAMNPERV